MPEQLISKDKWERAKQRSKSREEVLGERLTRGAVGLSMSHAKAWLTMIQNKVTMAIIFEDDVTEFYKHAREEICRQIPSLGKWQLVQMQGDESTWPKGKKRSTETTSLVEGSRSCLGMYMITIDGARRMLQHTFPMRHQLDSQKGPLTQIGTTHRFCPSLAQQSEIDSDVQTASDLLHTKPSLPELDHHHQSVKMMSQCHNEKANNSIDDVLNLSVVNSQPQPAVPTSHVSPQ
eukprot:CAMPEP_0197521040 /NCGR_PEP_ID=MMETSP1318-20131121/6342_1 /TAXON_ID=552666 /ORGANISM="Partenskyella glossopodia, Strain RCC365" /LENGTH=233 /DNA_ID=CAMNT_0043072851 /DNA_START=444 /DNA_END=1145 /DNA_ORIENTATION=+